MRVMVIVTGIALVAALCSGAAAASAGNGEGSTATAHAAAIGLPADPLGADGPLFGLKLAMEGLDETFTFNRSLRVEKQVEHARLRIAEAEEALARNRTDTAERLADLYFEKLNRTEMALAGPGDDGGGLLHAQEMVVRHQDVISDLISSHPGSQGLRRAYSGSLALTRAFEGKTSVTFSRVTEKDNTTVLRAERLERKNETGGRSSEEKGNGNTDGRPGHSGDRAEGGKKG